MVALSDKLQLVHIPILVWLHKPQAAVLGRIAKYNIKIL